MFDRSRLWFALAACACAQAANVLAFRAQAPPPEVQFVFTSDAHYGLSKGSFRSASNVSAHIVNMALVAKVNTLPTARFPDDGGLRAGQPVGALDFVVEGGDVTNREEGIGPSAIQSAAVSWSQFVADYFDGLTVKDHAGQRAPLYVVPGNHEASNAVGFYKPMTPAIDKTPMVEIFNRMVAPATPKNTVTFDYARDKIVHSQDVGGIHFIFLQVWADSAGRAWMERDLSAVSDRTPVVVFVHDQPDAEAKHFINPNRAHGINTVDKFENLLSDTFADGRTVDMPSTIEQAAFERFLARHRNITAYFHGNSNWNQFYEWTGPTNRIRLHTFRVDSPMKGAVSSRDERTLSFHVATIETATLKMTVRECLWNQGPGVAWGATKTVALREYSAWTR
jgi:Calcineurin-like phosphoesterase